MNIYNSLLDNKKQGKKLFAVLIDPDKIKISDLKKVSYECQESSVDFIFVGGSLLTNNVFDKCITTIKKNCSVPVIIFPGNIMQLNKDADAILFLSLISGRNADMLIGKHVIAAPIIKKMNLEVIPTGYMLVESGKLTSVTYISNTIPIPHDKDDIALCTALAGEMLGLKAIFLDGGSGAFNPISENMITKVSSQLNIPIIVGGGIKTPDKALQNCKAGADLIVVGNAIEYDTTRINEISHAIHSL